MSTKAAVILSEHSESKDLRTDFTANVIINAQISRLGIASLEMTDLLHCTF